MPWSSTSNLNSLLSGETFSLRNCRVPACAADDKALPLVGDGLLAADLVVSGGKIAWIGAPGSRPDLPSGADLDRAMVWPCPVDCHTHLDKGQVWARSPNEDGSFASAGSSAQADSLAHHSREDIARRAAFQLRAAYAHGTTAIRAHVDAGQHVFDTAFEVLSGLAEDWKDRIDLQLCPFTGADRPAEWIAYLAQQAATRKPGILSLFLRTAPGLDAFLDQVIELAESHGLALDFHADENLDPKSHCLRAVAGAVLRTGFAGPVMVGHCCALSVQPRAELDWTLDLVAEARIGVVSLPLCNAYLMDRRGGDTPRYRGVAPLHEMRRRGIPVALASDNVRDAFHAYGDNNVPELFRDALRMLHLDHPVGDWPAAVTTTAASLMGLSGRCRVGQGAPADLVLFPARNWSEFVSRPLSDRIVLRNGHPIDTTPPDYRDLDDLKGMRI